MGGSSNSAVLAGGFPQSKRGPHIALFATVPLGRLHVRFGAGTSVSGISPCLER